jgi:hypothetical protein
MIPTALHIIIAAAIAGAVAVGFWLAVMRAIATLPL